MNSKLLKSKRALTGILQKEIAGQIGMSEKTYHYKENGKGEFKPSEIIDIAALLDLSLKDIDEIFFDNELPIGKNTNLLLGGLR